MNRTIKEATVNRYYYHSAEELQKHLDVFIAAYNFAKRLKTIYGLTPYEFIVKSWTEYPPLFHSDPSHQKNRLVQREHGEFLYKYRHLIEDAFLKLKRRRGIATRYAKTLPAFVGAVNLAAIVLWLHCLT